MNSENVILFKNAPERGQQEFKIKTKNLWKFPMALKE